MRIGVVDHHQHAGRTLHVFTRFHQHDCAIADVQLRPVVRDPDPQREPERIAQEADRRASILVAQDRIDGLHGPPRRICRSGFGLDWLPDSKHLILSTPWGKGIPSAIARVSVETGAVTELPTAFKHSSSFVSVSPDGRQIVFESDREGSQELYVMNADGSGVRRISGADGGRYSTPVWSPRGDYIAFTKQMSGQFLIGVMHPDGTGERILTEGFHNEGPTWAPNGRVLMFFRESQGAQGGPRIHSVDITGYNERQVATPAFGSDPAWSPLLR